MAKTPTSPTYPNLSAQDNNYGPEEMPGYDITPDSGVHDLSSMDPEQRRKLEIEWREELRKTEEEIHILRQVLSAKVKTVNDLKIKLGITPWREFRDDMEQGIKNIQESNAYKEVSSKLVEWNSALTNAPIYQKTSQSLKTATDKTTTVLGSFGSNFTRKIGDMKNSPSFKSFEEKVGSAYTNVKTKLPGSRSTSVQNFEEALNNAGRSSADGTPASTPTIPEGKPLS